MSGLSIEQVKELSGEQNMPDEQAKLLRDSAQGMAEIVMELIREKKKKGLLPKVTYKQVEDPNSEGLNRAFDILFEATAKHRHR